MSDQNLAAAVCTVLGSVGSIPMTGRDQFGNRAHSIDDIEEALRPLLAEAGLAILWTQPEPPSVISPAGSHLLWQVHLRARVIHAASGEAVELDWHDVGSSPMAASSFARKGLLKALFHVAGEEEPTAVEVPSRPAPAPRPVVHPRDEVPPPPEPEDAPPPPPAPSPNGLECVQCAARGIRSRKGYPAKYWPGKYGDVQCDGYDTVAEKYLNHRPPAVPRSA